MSVLLTSVSMQVSEFATRTRIFLCKVRVWEFEEMRAILGVGMEMDFTGEMR